jgi:hypothetical protein
MWWYSIFELYFETHFAGKPSFFVTLFIVLRGNKQAQKIVNMVVESKVKFKWCCKMNMLLLHYCLVPVHIFN